jgi:hypothetical protein
VKWYQADHDGRPPDTLEELAPKYLPAAPADPFAAGAKPLRFLSDGKRLAVYSVGENGVDDDGSEASVNNRKPVPNRWEHLDAVMWLEGKPGESPGAEPVVSPREKRN